MELTIELSSAKRWISGFKGSLSVEKKNTCEKGKKPLTASEDLDWKKDSKKSRESFSRRGNTSKGKAVFCRSEVEELNERLMVLEEETEMLKKAFVWSLEERKVMMNEVYKQFQLLHSHGWLHIGDMEIEESSVVDPFESLTEILGQDQNPTLMTKALRVNALAFQEPASYSGHVKFHYD